MKNKTTWLIAGSALVPVVGARLTDPAGAATLRKVSFWTSLGTGAVYLLTRSSTAGAVALGTGGAWAIMRYGE